MNCDSSVYAESIARNTMSLLISSCFIVSESISTSSDHFIGANFVISVPWTSSLYRTIISSIFPQFEKYSDTSFPQLSGRVIRKISLSGYRIDRRLMSLSAHFLHASSLSKQIYIFLSLEKWDIHSSLNVPTPPVEVVATIHSFQSIIWSNSHSHITI